MEIEKESEMEIKSEYLLATLDGEVFYRGSDQGFREVAIAGFEKLIELYRKSSEDGDDKIAIEVSMQTSVVNASDVAQGPITKMGYLSWALRPKV